MTEFRSRRQTVNFLGFLRGQLSGLQGIPTLCYELIQNADDVKDEIGNPGATRSSSMSAMTRFTCTTTEFFGKSILNGWKRFRGGTNERRRGLLDLLAWVSFRFTRLPISGNFLKRKALAICSRRSEDERIRETLIKPRKQNSAFHGHLKNRKRDRARNVANLPRFAG